MKLSIEAKVAAAVGAGFVAWTVGAIGQGNSASQTGGPNGYGPTNNPGVNTQMSQQGYNSSLPGRTNAQVNRQKVANQDTTVTTPASGRKTKNAKPQKNHTRHVRQNQRSDMNEAGD